MAGSTVAAHTAMVSIVVGIHPHLTAMVLDRERGCQPGREAHMPYLHGPHPLSIATAVVGRMRTVSEIVIETDHRGAGL